MAREWLIEAARRVAAAVLALLALTAFAQPQARVDVTIFWGEGCPHCEREISFLKRLEAEESRLRVRYLEVTRDAANRRAFAAAVNRIALADPAVPLTLVGEAAMVGYESDDTSGAELRRMIGYCLTAGCPDLVGDTLGPRQGVAAESESKGGGEHQAAAAAGNRTEPESAAPTGPGDTNRPSAADARRVVPKEVNVPFFGKIAVSDLSLPVLTVVLGALDGFNPCAMWVLLFLIGLLVGMQDRFRMWTLGTAFIAGSALVYFLFMAAWLNFLLFMGAVVWVRAAVALVALGGGFYYLREYFRNPEGVCPVTAPQSRKRVFEGLRKLATESRFWLAFLGILALAFAVNLVELLCSAGIPAVYTQVLALSKLPAWQYYGYLALYILVFMLDDLFVFVVAMKTLQVAGVTADYSRFSHLAGGIVLLAIGALLLLRPELLMFG